jgi:hypothetical protein
VINIKNMDTHYNYSIDVSLAVEAEADKEEPDPIIVRPATSQDAKYAYIILREMINSA